MKTEREKLLEKHKRLVNKLGDVHHYADSSDNFQQTQYISSYLSQLENNLDKLLTVLRGDDSEQ